MRTLLLSLLLATGCSPATINVEGNTLNSSEDTGTDGCDGCNDDHGTSGVDIDGDSYDSDVDCNDYDPSVYPGALESPYDGVDSNCNGMEDDYDADGDGVVAIGYGGEDCNDADPSVYPGADDVWYDGVDADCAGNSDYDQDGDGFDSLAYGGADCNDLDAVFYPDAVEYWDGEDTDCGGELDDREELGLIVEAISGTRVTISNGDLSGHNLTSYFTLVDWDVMTTTTAWTTYAVDAVGICLGVVDSNLGGDVEGCRGAQIGAHWMRTVTGNGSSDSGMTGVLWNSTHTECVVWGFDVTLGAGCLDITSQVIVITL